MAGKTSSKTTKPSKRTALKKSSSAKRSTLGSRSARSKTSARKAKPKKGKTLVKKKTPKATTKKQKKETPIKGKKSLVKENPLPSIEMEKVQTIKGIIELPKRRRGRPTKEEEDLRTKILKEHDITGDPRVKRPRGRPRKDQSNLLSSQGYPRPITILENHSISTLLKFRTS